MMMIPDRVVLVQCCYDSTTAKVGKTVWRC